MTCHATRDRQLWIRNEQRLSEWRRKIYQRRLAERDNMRQFTRQFARLEQAERVAEWAAVAVIVLVILCVVYLLIG